MDPASLTRPFLKWAGGKSRLVDFLKSHFPPTHLYVEPFIGAGAVFLNTQYPEAILNDINPDLMALYHLIKNDVESFILEARPLFQAKNNKSSRYYQLRSAFNRSTDKDKRALLFLYLNRHGYNGLCRYNQKGKLNVPFGHYKTPYFPEKELYAFHQRLKTATLYEGDYRKILTHAPRGSLVYCDPPYAPVSKTAHFTNYSQQSFSFEQQEELALLAKKSAQEGAHVFISNHDLPLTRQLYEGATAIYEITVARSISCNPEKRLPIKELLAHYAP